MRKPFVGGNWKMFLDKRRGIELTQAIVRGTENVIDRDILICPAYPLLSDVAHVLEGSKILLGGQNLYFEKEGAYTGEVSAKMLLSVSCTHVIIGHSERRHIFLESNEYINKKVIAALQSGLKPVICVGELLNEREAGKTESVVKEQISSGMKDITEVFLKDIVIAYEPVWAIGTGKPQLQKMRTVFILISER